MVNGEMRVCLMYIYQGLYLSMETLFSYFVYHHEFDGLLYLDKEQTTIINKTHVDQDTESIDVLCTVRLEDRGGRIDKSLAPNNTLFSFGATTCSNCLAV